MALNKIRVFFLSAECDSFDDFKDVAAKTGELLSNELDSS